MTVWESRSERRREGLGRRAAAVALVAVVLLGGCGRRAPNATPDGAVRELVDRLRQAHGDPADAKAAVDLLSKRTQANLAARAQRYSAASGKTIAPEAILAPARFILRFEPQRYTARIAGGYALVEISGRLASDRAQIPCVLEDGAWRVELALPPLPPVQMRPGISP
jgi:hypothetical protein